MQSCHYSFLSNNKLVECNTKEINEFNLKLTDITNNSTHYNSTNVLTYTLANSKNGFSPISIESVKCAKIIYKSTYY